MIFQNIEQNTEWLKNKNLIEKPYDNNGIPNSTYFRFYIPQNSGKMSNLIRSLFFLFDDFPGGLMVFNDNVQLEDYELELIEDIRKSNGAIKNIYENPGCVFLNNERNKAIGQCIVSQLSKWSIYFYSSSKDITLYFWENLIIDIWSSNSEANNLLNEWKSFYGKSPDG